MLHDALMLVLGAALVSGGVFTTAAADKIRGLRVSRPDRADRGRDREPAVANAQTEPATPRAKAKAPISLQAAHAAAGYHDVVRALRGAGFKSAGVAERAADACTTEERESLELWTRAALKRCANRVEA
jgi:hypothetical protein